jgi:hypothetical protein
MLPDCFGFPASLPALRGLRRELVAGNKIKMIAAIATPGGATVIDAKGKV